MAYVLLAFSPNIFLLSFLPSFRFLSCLYSLPQFSLLLTISISIVTWFLRALSIQSLHRLPFYYKSNFGFMCSVLVSMYPMIRLFISYSPIARLFTLLAIFIPSTSRSHFNYPSSRNSQSVYFIRNHISTTVLNTFSYWSTSPLIISTYVLVLSFSHFIYLFIYYYYFFQPKPLA